MLAGSVKVAPDTAGDVELGAGCNVVPGRAVAGNSISVGADARFVGASVPEELTLHKGAGGFGVCEP